MTYQTMNPPFQDSSRLVYAERILIVLGMLVLFFFAGKPVSDGMARYLALDQLLHGRGFSETIYSMIGPIFAAPLWYLGELTGSSLWWVGKFNSIVFMIGMLWFWRTLKPHVPASFIRKFVLLLIAASMFGRPAMGFFGEMFTTIMVGGGIMALAFRPSRLAWVAIILGVQNSPATFIGLTLFALFYAHHHRRARYLLAPVVSVLFLFAESWLRRGSPFVSGYEGASGGEYLMAPFSGLPGFSYPFVLGILGIFLSFGKGLLFFAPGLFLPVRRRLESFDPALTLAYTSWLVFLGGLVLVYSKWWAWPGDWYWGPRFFLIASLISCFVVAVHLVRPSTKVVVNLFVLLVLGLSLWVGLNGLIFDNIGLLEVCAANDYRLAWACFFVPEYSVLVHPLIEPRPLRPQQLAVSAYLAVTAAVLVGPQVTLIGRQLANRLRGGLDDVRKGWEF